MTTQVRLNSVVCNDIGGPETGALDLIYEFLLKKYGQNWYGYISINQIGDSLDEVIIKMGKEIHINVRYASPENLDSLSSIEKNRIRLEVMHIGMLRIAEKENKLDVEILEKIKHEIIEQSFSFDFSIKTFPNKKQKNLVAILRVQPETQQFKYFVRILREEKVVCEQLIYVGGTTIYFLRDMFYYGKWRGDNRFVLTGREKEQEIHIIVDQCKVEYINLTGYDNPPFSQMFRRDISEEERKKAKEDWMHSLPPAVAAILRQTSDNASN